MTEPTSNRPAGGPDPSEGESPAGGGPQATSETDAARGDAPATPERSPGPKGPDAEASAAEAGPPVRPRPAPDSTAAARRRAGSGWWPSGSWPAQRSSGSGC